LSAGDSFILTEWRDYKIMNRVLMALLFYGLITPLAVLLRLLGRDLIQSQPDTQVNSYWQRLEPIETRNRR
jgi:hypothetical protein